MSATSGLVLLKALVKSLIFGHGFGLQVREPIEPDTASVRSELPYA